MVMFSSSRLAVLEGTQTHSKYPGNSWNTVRNTSFPWAHLPWKSRLSSLQALMETSTEVECLFIISTTLTWRPLDSSKERILPANT